MSDDFADFMVHTVTVTALTGSGGMGDTWANPVGLVCFADEKRRLVRAQDASEVISEATLYAAAGTVIPVGSTVVLPSGRTATVISTAARDSGPLDLGDHVEIATT